MNSLKSYFSPTKMNPPPVPEPPPERIEIIDKADTKLKSDSKTSSSRQICSNMESVINSVKKKHRHRKKKDAVNISEPEITDISNILSNSLNFVSPDVTLNAEVKDMKSPLKENLGNKKIKKRSRTPRKMTKAGKNSSTPSSSQASASTTPSSSQASTSTPSSLSQTSASTTDSGITILSPARKGSIRDHFSPENKSSPPVTISNDAKSEKLVPKMNAFALMMNARNRSIGSNTSGKENPNVEITATLDPEKVKRKLMLEEWADRKGGAKRKIEEVQREEYIEHALENRAKRFKKMLIGDNNLPKPPPKKRGRPRKIVPSADQPDTPKEPTTTLQEVVIANLVPSSQQAPENGIKSQAGSKLRRLRKIKTPTTPKSEDPIQPEPSSSSKRKVASNQIGKRVRRLLSAESNGTVSNSQDSNFMQKLSSPIKKRDSLLGYFQKVVSPSETVPSDGPVTSTPSSRPRRSCAGKARYDYDLEESPNKNHSKVVSKRQKASMECDDMDMVEVICLDVSNDNAESNKSTKLAPLFVKSVPKPAIDPEILKAKQNFLMSGIPDKMKMEMAKQKQYEESYEISLETMFPRISHVGQEPIENGENGAVDWEKCGIVWQNCKESPDGKMNSRKNAAGMNPITPEKRTLPPLKKLADLDDKVGFVKSLKPMFDKFPTYRCYKQLRDKYKQQKAIGVEQVSDSFVIMNTRQHASSKKSAHEDDRVGNGEILFTEKYKPMNFDQVLVNFHPVNELKSFLSSWQNGHGSKLNDSMSDFDCSNDSMSLAGNCNSVVLHGPSSSGKTNAVFALANEMNFNVLEINAGMKRTGKKILQDLQEATQSHQVGKDKGGLLKKSFSGPKAKLNDLNNDSSSSTDLSGSAKLSLILVEDADVVFEQDSGFIEAIYQLVAVSKRPVIIVSNNSECQHLLRLQKQSAIEFAMPNVLNISKFLSVMSLVENCPIELDDIISLYLFNKRNLRKTLLEMQFFIQSGGDRYRSNVDGIRANLLSPVRKFSVEGRRNSTGEENVADDKCDKLRNMKAKKVYTHQTLFEFYTINQNAMFSVRFPVDFECLNFNLKTIMDRFQSTKDVASKRKRPKNSECSQKPPNVLENLVKFYDNISAASYLIASQVEDRLCENLQETIAHTLTEQAIRINLNATGKLDNIPRTLPERTLLAPFLSTNNVRTSRSIDLDYEPTLRAICRSERSRSTIERRGSRFYHYLRNICMSTSTFSTLEFDNACSVFTSTSTTTNDSDNDVHCD